MFKLQKLMLFAVLSSATFGLMNVNLACPSLPRLNSPVNILQVLWQSYESLFRSPKPDDGIRLLFFSNRNDKNFSVFKVVFEVKTVSGRFNQYYLALEAVYANNEYSISRFIQTTDMVEAQRVIRIGTIDLYRGYACANFRDSFMTYKGLGDIALTKDKPNDGKNGNDLDFEKLLAFEIDDALNGAETYSMPPKEESLGKNSKSLSREELLTIVNKKGMTNPTQDKTEGNKLAVTTPLNSEKSIPKAKQTEEKNSSDANETKISAAEKEIDELLGLLDDSESTTPAPPVISANSKMQNQPLKNSPVTKGADKNIKDSNKIQINTADASKNAQTGIDDLALNSAKQNSQSSNSKLNDLPVKQTRKGMEGLPINVVTQKKSLNFETATDDEIEEKMNGKDSRTVRTTNTKSMDKTQADTVITGSVNSLNNNQNLQLIKLLTNLGLLGGKTNENSQNPVTTVNSFIVKGTNAESDSPFGDNLRVRNRGTVQEGSRTPEVTLNLHGGNDPLFLRYYNQGFANNSAQTQSNVPVRGIRTVN